MEGNAALNKIIAVSSFVGTILAIGGVWLINRFTARGL